MIRRVLQTGFALLAALLVTISAPAWARSPIPPAAIADSLAAEKAAALESSVIETIHLGKVDLKARHIRPHGAGLATVILVHDTLGSFESSLITDLQTALAVRGWSTLAINLSLGMSGRMSAFDCSASHRHRHEDALAEIDAWVNWLQGEGLGPVGIVGHGRGGAQAAWYLADRAGERVSAAVLLGPKGWTPRSADAEYRARYKAGIASLLTKIAGSKPDEFVESVPFLHCGSVTASHASIESYYGVQPMRDAPTALQTVTIPTLALFPGTLGEEGDVGKRLKAVENEALTVRTIPASDGLAPLFGPKALSESIPVIEAYLRSLLLEQ